MPELVACQSCQSAPARAVRLAWARRLRRLTPLPWPSPRAFGCGLWLDLSREQRASGVQLVCLFALDAILCSRPCSWQRSVTARAAHSADDQRRHALFMAKPLNEPSMTERAIVAPACAWMQLLKLRKTATSQGCKYDVLHDVNEAQYDVWESRPHSGQRGLAGVDAGHVQGRIHACPSLLGFSTLSNAAVSCRIVVVVAQGQRDQRPRTSFFSRKKHPCFTTVYAALCLNDVTRRHQTIHKQETRSIAVELWTRPPVLSPALSQASHRPMSVHIRPCCRLATKTSSSSAEMTFSATFYS